MADRLRTLEHRFVQPIARRLAPYVSANVVSAMSLVAALAAGIAFCASEPILGAILILTNGFLDMLDGCVARERGTAGAFGSFVVPTEVKVIFTLPVHAGSGNENSISTEASSCMPDIGYVNVGASVTLSV